MSVIDDRFWGNGFVVRAVEMACDQSNTPLDECLAAQMSFVRDSQMDFAIDPAMIERIEPIFFDHRCRLIDDFIKVYPIIFGCVAWLSDPEILEALRDREAVTVIVNDVGVQPDGDGMRSFLKGCPVFPVAVGHAPGSLMHHKFLVGCVKEPNGFRPQAVWTGSFNFTRSAGYHWENVLLIKSVALGMSYLAEFLRVYRLGVRIWPELRAVDYMRSGTFQAEVSLKTSYDLARERELSAFYAGEAAFPSGLCAAALLSVERPQCPYSDEKLAKSWNAGFDRAAGEAARSLEPYWSDGELLRAIHLGAQTVWSGRGRKCPFRRSDRVQAWKVGYDEAHRLMNERSPVVGDNKM